MTGQKAPSDCSMDVELEGWGLDTGPEGGGWSPWEGKRERDGGGVGAESMVTERKELRCCPCLDALLRRLNKTGSQSPGTKQPAAQ